ncbi:hypothetical protein PFNF135_00272 [Plasmodium falciparum NF135/5.C10]|uniref:Uncharacterized protein n=1 Tax=Plasmodium falciparum NF135/5.C10 TaxID=1036726 RepID=W4INV9_PLAFA|nr:hypothetical protein PFNF135_00272 [Plasmodium falciparum NF135/5.C10]
MSFKNNEKYMDEENDQESDDEFFKVKRKPQINVDAEEDEDNNNNNNNNNNSNISNHMNEFDLEEEDEDDYEDENYIVGETIEIDESKLKNEKIEEDIFNENNLLHGIKTRELLEQEILILFSNMLKKETILCKDIKSGSNDPMDEISLFKDDMVDDKELKDFEKSSLKIKNKEVYNFIYNKMNLHIKENKKKDEKEKKNKIHNNDENNNMIYYKNIDKTHYILDNNVVHILNDINTYLKRERDYMNRKFGTYIDSTYKNPMYVTLYIFNNDILKDIILQVIDIIRNDFDHAIYKDIDENQLIKNLIILINHLTTRPSKEWFDYWKRHMPTFNDKKSEYNVYKYLQLQKSDRRILYDTLKNDIYIKELQKRSDILDQYQKGLQSLKCLLANKNFLTMLNEFRYNTQLFIDADYREIEENEKVMEMQRRENELLEEKKRLKQELESYHDDSSTDDDSSADEQQDERREVLTHNDPINKKDDPINKNDDPINKNDDIVMTIHIIVMTIHILVMTIHIIVRTMHILVMR